MGLKIFDLTGKVAMVTGSTRGLGEVAAKALAKAGADVAICGRKQEDLDRVSADIRGLGRKSAGFSLEVTSIKSINQGVAKILDYFGRVDILVNNAGINYREPILNYEEEGWDRVIDTHLKGYFFVAKAVAPQMISRGYGKIINISSIAAQSVIPTQVTYCAAYHAAKGGVNQLTKVMAVEWAQNGVRVNAIGPTYFETEMVKKVLTDKERVKVINDHTPMGRMGKLDELEGTVIFLAAPASDFITAQVIYVDGGWTAF